MPAPPRETIASAVIIAFFAFAGSASAAPRGYATLLFQSQPAGAKLHLDSALYTDKLGDTDFPLTLTPGLKVTVRVTKAGYGPFSRQFNMPAGEVRRVQVSLKRGANPVVEESLIKRAPQGTVDIVANINGATIEIDGKVRGRSPVLGLSLSVGQSYGVTISAPGYLSWERTLVVNKGRNPTFVASLVPRKAQAPTPAAPAATPRAPAPLPLKIALKVRGSAVRGKPLFAQRCGSCHGKAVKTLKPTDRTAAQWSRFLASGRHAFRVSLVGKVSLKELAHIKSYLMSKAADVERATAAGVR